jgi:hypothetical protein
MNVTTEDVTQETPTEEEPKKKGRPKKEPPPPVQRTIHPSKADEKVKNVIEFVKAAKEPVTYDQMIEGTGLPKHGYDVCQFSMTALAYVGLVEKVGTMTGSGRSRVAWKWVGKK